MNEQKKIKNLIFKMPILSLPVSIAVYTTGCLINYTLLIKSDPL